MSAPILSIVIPTYNRAQLLRLLLDSIITDFAEWPVDLELIVIDNASTDGTREMLVDYAARCPALVVMTQPENIGMDGNLAACFGAASGKYFWQIGDDDLLFKGAASWVLSFCRRTSFGLLHLSNAALVPGRQAEQRLSRVPVPALRPAAVDSTTMIRLANIFLTFISANVVNRRQLLASQPSFDFEGDLGTHIPQMAWIYGVLTCCSVHYLLRTPIFGALAGNTGGYALLEVFGKHLGRITSQRLAPQFPAASRVLDNATLLRLIPAQLVALRRRVTGNAFSDEDIGGTLDRLYGSRRYYRWLVRPIVLGAAWRSEAMFFALRVFNKVDRLVGHRLL